MYRCASPTLLWGDFPTTVMVTRPQMDQRSGREYLTIGTFFSFRLKFHIYTFSACAADLSVLSISEPHASVCLTYWSHSITLWEDGAWPYSWHTAAFLPLLCVGCCRGDVGGGDSFRFHSKSLKYSPLITAEQTLIRKWLKRCSVKLCISP